MSNFLELIQHFMRWLLGASFEELQPKFGVLAPVEVRIFETEIEEIQNYSGGDVRRF